MPYHPVAGDLQLRVAAPVGLELLRASGGTRSRRPRRLASGRARARRPARLRRSRCTRGSGRPDVADQRQEAILELRLGPWRRARQLRDRRSSASWRRGGVGSARAGPRARGRSAAPCARASPAPSGCRWPWRPRRSRGRSAPARSPESRRRPRDRRPRAALGRVDPNAGRARGCRPCPGTVTSISPLSAGLHVPDGEREPMAEQRIGSAREHGGHPVRPSA